MNCADWKFTPFKFVWLKFESIKTEFKKNANIIICSNFSERIIYKSLKTFRDKGMKTYNLYDSKIKWRNTLITQI